MLVPAAIQQQIVEQAPPLVAYVPSRLAPGWQLRGLDDHGHGAHDLLPEPRGREIQFLVKPNAGSCGFGQKTFQMAGVKTYYDAQRRAAAGVALRQRREDQRGDVTPAQPLRGRRPRAPRRLRPPASALAAGRDSRSNAIPAKIRTPPAISIACSDSESRSRAKSTAKNG